MEVRQKSRPRDLAVLNPYRYRGESKAQCVTEFMDIPHQATDAKTPPLCLLLGPASNQCAAGFRLVISKTGDLLLLQC